MSPVPLVSSPCGSPRSSSHQRRLPRRMGNHELYMRRRRKTNIGQIKSQNKEEKLAKPQEREKL